MKLTLWQRYGLFGVFTGLHILALLSSSFLAKGLVIVDLVVLFFVLPLAPKPEPELVEMEMHVEQVHDGKSEEEHTFSVLEYLREIESGFHQRLDGLEGMLEENTMLTKIRRRGKGTLTLVPSNEQEESHDPTEPSKHA